MAKSKAGAAKRVPIRKLKSAEPDELPEKLEPDEEEEEAKATTTPVAADDAQDEDAETDDAPEPAPAKMRGDVLDAIYKPESGAEDDEVESPQDLKKAVPKSKRKRRLIVLFVVLGILAAATLAGFLVFRSSTRFSERVQLTAKAPADVAAGDEVSVVITVTNEEQIALQNAELTLTPPEGFTFASSQPAASNEFNNAWHLGTLQKSAGTTVTVKGRLVGDQDQDKVFRFTLGYRPSNFNYDFQKNLEVTIRISSSVLQLQPDVPLRITPGVQTQIPIVVLNTGSAELENIRLVVEYPGSFTFGSATPKPSREENIWDIASIPAKGETKITVTGTLQGNVGDTPEFKFRAGRVQTGELQVQAEASGIGTLVQPGLQVTLNVTNPGGGTVLGWGDMLNLSISYKNESESNMQDVTIVAELREKNGGGKDSIIFDLDNRSDVQKGTLSGRTLTWTKAQVPGLAKIEPGKGGDILLRLPVRSGPNITEQGDKNFTSTIAVRASVGSMDDVTGKNFETQAKPLETKFSTKLNVEPEGRYYSDEQVPIGTGPLPPQVGKETMYEMSWTLTNATNEATQIVVTATLPDAATWTGVQSVTAGQAVTYDPTSREITWRVNRVPPGTGSLFASLEAKFQVKVTPVATDVGKLLTLLGQTVATARDEFTNQDLRVEKAIITSDLPGDVAAVGKGLVVEAAP